MGEVVRGRDFIRDSEGAGETVTRSQSDSGGRQDPPRG
jgi:hypothetical protein